MSQLKLIMQYQPRNIEQELILYRGMNLEGLDVGTLKRDGLLAPGIHSFGENKLKQIWSDHFGIDLDNDPYGKIVECQESTGYPTGLFEKASDIRSIRPFVSFTDKPRVAESYAMRGFGKEYIIVTSVPKRRIAKLQDIKDKRTTEIEEVLVDNTNGYYPKDREFISTKFVFPPKYILGFWQNGTVRKFLGEKES